MKKNLLLYILLLFPSILTAQTVTINPAGHIIPSREEPLAHAVYFTQDGQKLIELDGMQFKGNGIYQSRNGYLTVEAYEESVPVAMRFYDTSGRKQKEMHFNRVYNLNFSPDKGHLVFFDARKLIAINTLDHSLREFPGSAVFAIDNQGVPFIYKEANRQLLIGEETMAFPGHAHKIIIHNDRPVVFTRDEVFLIEEGLPVSIHKLEGTFFRALSHEQQLYFVSRKADREQFEFILHRMETDHSLINLDTAIYQRNTRTLGHEAIPSPLKYGEDYAHPISNSYGAIQQYNGNPYLHPGVDFLGDANEDVFSVADGVVKAVLTTGGIYNYRIAIANEDTDEETDGYLYAHLVETSIPFVPGDSVFAGDVVGELVYWPWYEFTHIHFARIKASGNIWNGAWWTTNNPHIDVFELIDITPPIFENAIGNDLFAFRDESLNYLDPMNLQGDVRIIAKVHDLANTHWKIDVYQLSYKIYEDQNPDEPLVEQISFAYDFMLDTYFSNVHESMILQTIYSRDATCFSIANYVQRDYYQMITNTSGDEDIHEGDKNIMLDTRNIPNGSYTLGVTAVDASMNETTATMTIGIQNEGIEEPYALAIETDGLEQGEALFSWLHEEETAKGNNEKASRALEFIGFNVFLNEEEVATEIAGKEFLFSGLDEGEHTAGVQAVYNQGLSGIVSIDFEMEAPVFQLTFEISNQQGEPIPDAIVSLDGTPNEAGDYVFDDLQAGTYDFLVSRDGYFDYSGEVSLTDSDKTVEVTMQIDDTGLAGPAQKGIKIFPNPAGSVLSVVSGDGLIREIRIYDMQGKQVYLAKVNAGKHLINVSGFEAGIYLLQIQCPEGVSTHSVKITGR